MQLVIVFLQWNRKFMLLELLADEFLLFISIVKLFLSTMELKKNLGFKDSFFLVFTSMVGSGIFFTTGFVLQSASHPLAVLACWILGAIFALLGALSYSYLAVLYPHAGGDYVYLKKAYSVKLAFLSGWASFLANFSANIAVLSLAFVKHLNFIFPSLKPSEPLFFIFEIPIYFGIYQWIALGLVWGFSLLHVTRVKLAIQIQNLLSEFKIFGIFVFLGLGFLIGNIDWGNFSLSYGENPPYPNWEWSFSTIQGIFLGMIPVSFAYFGWNMVTYVAEEVKEPEKIIPQSVSLACFFVGIIYLLMNILYLGSSNSETLISAKEGVGVASATALFGEIGKQTMSVFILVMILGSLPAMIFAGSRIYYAMARDGVFFRFLKHVHPKWHTPHYALLFQASYTSFLILLGDVEKLLYFMTCSILLLSILTTLIPIYLDFQQKTPKTSYKIPLYPFPPLIYALGTMVLLIYFAILSPENALAGIFITLLGIPAYYLFRYFQNEGHKVGNES